MSGVARATDGEERANADVEPVDDDDDRELEAALRSVIEARLAGMGDAERNDAMLTALASAADGDTGDDGDGIVNVASVVDEATRRARHEGGRD